MSNSGYLIEKFILYLYSKIFSANASIKVDNFNLKAYVKFNFNFSNYPKDIKISIPRRYDKKEDYFSVEVPLLHKPYEYSTFTQHYIKDKKNEFSRFFKGSFTQKDYVPYIFEFLENWLIFRFFHFLFKFTGTMRNEKNQIQSFETTSSVRFWELIKPFLFPFWFIKFFFKTFPRIFHFLDQVKGLRNYYSIIQDLTGKIDIDEIFFEKFTGLYPVLFDNDNFYICKFLEGREINSIFFGDLTSLKWFSNIYNNFQKKGFKFNKDKTKWLNHIEKGKISKGQYVCFYFCSQ